jgi:hypothetical protein
MRAHGSGQWTKVSLIASGDNEEIMPGDRFISPNDNKESVVIGFSDSLVFGLKDPLSWGLSEKLVWALKKDESRIGCFDKNGKTQKEIKKTLIKAKKPMKPETAEEDINNFLNS